METMRLTVLKRFVYLIDAVSKWSGQIIAPLVLASLAVLIFEITARYFFNAPTKWAHETSTFFFGAQFILGGAYCFYRGGMVNVEILHDRLSIRGRAILDLFLFIAPLVICIAMIWRGGYWFLDSVKINEHTQTVFGPPLYPLRGLIPLAAFLLLMQLVAKFVRDLHLVITGKELK